MRGLTKAIILIILSLAILIPLASTFPDGLERVVQSLGLEEPESFWSGVMPDYTFPLASNPYMTKFISGLIGLFAVFGVAWGVGRAITHKDRLPK